jgi:chromosome segregation ATPase
MSSHPSSPPNPVKPRYRSHYETAPQAVNLKSRAAMSESESPSQELVVQSMRDAAAARFEAYRSQLDQIERAFIRERKTLDQQSTRNLSRFSDAILGMSLEISQLTKRSGDLSQKVRDLSGRLGDVTSSALNQALDPVRANFQELESEQTRAAADIAELLAAFATRAAKIKGTFDALSSVLPELTEFSNTIEQLKVTVQKNSASLLAAREDLSAQMEEQRALFLQQMDGRIRDIATKLDGFRAKSQTAARESQDRLADLESAQFELRALSSEAISRVQAQFGGQMAAVKRRFAQLTELRYSQILAVREQIGEANSAIGRKRQAGLQRGIAQRAAGAHRATRMADEIRALGEQCDAIEGALATGVWAAPKRRPPGVRVFYNVGPDGFVRLIFVDQLGVIGT